MKIKLYEVSRQTLSEFADEHGLVMEVHERGGFRTGCGRYYANFKKCETKDGNILCGEFGDGATPSDAMSHYAERISGKLLVYNAYANDRIEIKVPELFT